MIMLTFITTPKPFVGHVGDIQANAMRSWAALRPRCEIIILGDEAGSSEIAQEIGATHVPAIPRNRWGTPLLDGLLETSKRETRQEYLCYINADIIVTDEFPDHARAIMAWRRKFLMVGRRTTIDLKGQLDMRSPWAESVRKEARTNGRLDSSHAIDFFFSHRDCFVNVPPFAIGRFAWDNWLIYSAASRGIPVVDITKSTTVIHQAHDYSHAATDKISLWDGEEAIINRELAGGPLHLLTLDDATHVFDGRSVRRNLSGVRFRRALARRIKSVFPGAGDALRRLSLARPQT